MGILPHDSKFFEVFDLQIRLVREAAGHLCSSTSNGTSSSEAARKIRELEEKGNRALDEVLERLEKVFITPLDPEDLHELAAQIDHVLDEFESVAYRLDAYDIHPVPEDMGKLCALASKAAEKLCEAFDGLKTKKLKDRWQQIAASCQEIVAIDRKAQEQSRRSILQLLESEKDVQALLKRKELYDRLEDISHQLKATADVLRTVVIKNS